MAYGLIATPGAVDSHVHLITPELMPAALSGGVTTLITAGLRGAAVGDGADARRDSSRVADQRRAPGLRPLGGLRRDLERAARRRRDRLQDPRGLRRVPGADRRDAARSPTRATSRSRSTPTGSTSRPSSRTRSRRSPAGRSTPTTSRAPAADTCPTCSASSASRTSSARRRRRRSPTASTPPPSTSPMIVLNHGGSMGVPDDVELAPRAHPPRDDGRRGPAPRARRDRDHQLATRRAWAGSWSRSGGRSSLPTCMKRWRAPSSDWPRGPPLRRPTTTPSASCATSPRSRSSRRSPTASPTTSARSDRAGWPTSSSGSRPGSGVKPELVLKSGYAGLGARSARATRPSSGPSRRAIARTGAARARSRLGSASRSPRQARPTGFASAPRAGREVVEIGRTRGLTRRGPRLNRAIRADRDRPDRRRVTLAGRPLAVDPVDDLPLSRRYFLR